jgi:hypothetical protein
MVHRGKEILKDFTPHLIEEACPKGIINEELIG